jgi:hypothetical protein
VLYGRPYNTDSRMMAVSGTPGTKPTLNRLGGLPAFRARRCAATESSSNYAILAELVACRRQPGPLPVALEQPGGPAGSGGLRRAPAGSGGLRRAPAATLYRYPAWPGHRQGLAGLLAGYLVTSSAR